MNTAIIGLGAVFSQQILTSELLELSKEPSYTENVLVSGYSQRAVFGLFAGVDIYQHGVYADILSCFL